MPRIACVQLNAGPEIAPNLEIAADHVRSAAADGADLIALPENATMVVHGREAILARARHEGDHPAIPVFATLARETGVPILVGSLAVLLEDGRAANRSFLFAADGTVLARYDKLHMFDVDLPGGESYRESDTFRPGDSAVVADLPWARLGLSICYDVRFPHLYRDLARAGADVIAVPSAFTRQTGEAHWHLLLRARAIETGCFIVAPAQTGTHHKDRKTFGHSLIVDPWGRVLADAGTEPGIVAADIDLERISAARGAVPALSHDRAYHVPRPAPEGRAAE